MRARRLLLQALITLLMLEVILQVGSVVVWLAFARDNDIATDGRVMLAVGDSFTYGIGSSDANGPYPAQLGRELTERSGGEVSIANCGYPGQHTADVLRRLDADLKTWRPEHVFVLVGVNDLWRGVEKVELPPVAAADLEAPRSGGASSYKFRFRVGHLAVWLYDRVTSGAGAGVGPGAEPAGEKPTPGAGKLRQRLVTTTWQTAQGGEIRLQSNGVLVAGPMRGAWSMGEDGRFRMGIGADPVPYTIVEHEDRLELTAEGNHPDVVLIAVVDEPGTPEPETVDRDFGTIMQEARAAMRERRHADALALYDEAQSISTRPYQFFLIEDRRATALVQAGRQDEARQVLADLLEASDDGNAIGRAEAIVSAYRALGVIDELHAWCARHSASFEDSFRVQYQYAWSSRRKSLFDEAMAAVDRALAASRSDSQRGRALRLRADIRKGEQQDPALIVEDAARAFAFDGRGKQFLSTMRLSRVDAGPHLDAVMSRLEWSEEQRRALLAVVEGAAESRSDDKEKIVADLSANVVQIIERCRKYGAEVTLVGYPQHPARHAQAMQLAASTAKVNFVETQSAFFEAMKSTAREDLFCEDESHCSDLGYGLMAKSVADVFLRD